MENPADVIRIQYDFIVQVLITHSLMKYLNYLV